MHVRGHHIVKVSQAVEVNVHQDNVRPEPRRHLGGIGPHDARAQHDDVRRRDARHAAKQDAAPHHRLLKILALPECSSSPQSHSSA